VITQAGDLPNVVGLVYVAAFAPDAGESVAQIGDWRVPQAAAAGNIAPDSDGCRRQPGPALTGHVRTWAEHDAVINAAWMATGVYDVRDDLYVTG
jgi:hypothetical protein